MCMCIYIYSSHRFIWHVAYVYVSPSDGVETNGEVVTTQKKNGNSLVSLSMAETLLRSRKRLLQPANYTLAKSYYKQVISIGTFVGFANDINVLLDDLQSSEARDSICTDVSLTLVKSRKRCMFDSFLPSIFRQSKVCFLCSSLSCFFCCIAQAFRILLR